MSSSVNWNIEEHKDELGTIFASSLLLNGTHRKCHEHGGDERVMHIVCRCAWVCVCVLGEHAQSYLGWADIYNYTWKKSQLT